VKREPGMAEVTITQLHSLDLSSNGNGHGEEV
jgi:hypothetical protein